MPKQAARAARAEWEVNALSMAVGAVSGDVHVYRQCPGGILLGVVDGAGHGQPARDAAQIATRILGTAIGEPLTELVVRCHKAMLFTRGAAMTLVWFRREGGTIEWLGIGNVEACLIRASSRPPWRHECITLQRGVVGYRLPAPRSESLSISPGDVLVMASDGMYADFASHVNPYYPVTRIAAELMETRWKGHDDALVLVARYQGGEK